jgi:hypothetical protein
MLIKEEMWARKQVGELYFLPKEYKAVQRSRSERRKRSRR